MPPVAAAFAAVAAGTATVAAVATVVSTVGVGLSVVGKLTGSKDLMKVGGIMSLAGGVTSLASGAIGAASAAEGVAGATEGAMGAEGALDLAGQDIATTAYSGADPSPMFSDAASEAGTAGLGTANSAAGTSIPGLTDSSISETKGSGLLNASKDVGGFGRDINLGNSGAPAPEQAISNISPMNPNASIAPPPGTDSNSVKSWWDGLSDRSKTAIVQAGGNAIGGMFQGWSADQKLAFEREKQNLITSNANAQPTVRFKPTGLLSAQRNA